MWFAGGGQDALEDAGQDGWRGVATASSAALGAFPLAHRGGRSPRYSIPGSGNHMLTSGLNDFVGRFRVDFVSRARCLSWSRRLNMDFTKSIEHHLKASVAFGLLAAVARSILAESEEP